MPRNLGARDMSRIMPALSIRQPWAWLIVHGYKDVENRDWATNFRGRFLVHAGKVMTLPYYEDQIGAMAEHHLLPAGIPSYEEMCTQRGGIVGEARMTDCRDYSPSRWYLPGGFAWSLADAKPLPFWPMKGRLGFFNVEVAAP
jgi:hypothetical protein